MVAPCAFHRDGEPIRSIRGAWKGALKRAKLEGLWFHDLRRRAIVNLDRAGVARSVATKITGHKTESLTGRPGDDCATARSRHKPSPTENYPIA